MTLQLATLERARAYLNTDAPLLGIVSLDQELTGESVRLISTAYFVRRNLGSRLEVVARHINTSITSWPDDLTGRAAWCRDQAEALRTSLSLPHVAHSAVSKLAWFLRPAGWTLYDSYARKALHVRGVHGAGPFTSFYDTLSINGFAEAAGKIDAILAGTVWSDLRGARVLDAYLMDKGGFPFLLGSSAAQDGFLAALPSPAGQTLSALANRIASELATDPFITFVESL